MQRQKCMVCYESWMKWGELTTEKKKHDNWLTQSLVCHTSKDKHTRNKTSLEWHDRKVKPKATPAIKIPKVSTIKRTLFNKPHRDLSEMSILQADPSCSTNLRRKPLSICGTLFLSLATWFPFWWCPRLGTPRTCCFPWGSLQSQHF